VVVTAFDAGIFCRNTLRLDQQIPRTSSCVEWASKQSIVSLTSHLRELSFSTPTETQGNALSVLFAEISKPKGHVFKAQFGP